MDFGRTLVRERGVATRSNIRIVPPLPPPSEEECGNDGGKEKRTRTKPSPPSILDNMVIDAANRAAADLFLGPEAAATVVGRRGDDDGDDDHLGRLIDSSLYATRSLPPHAVIEPGSLVVVFESFDNLGFVYATPGSIFSNRNGHFHHDDFLGKPFGCKIRSRNNRGFGFVYLLRPTPELWARSLPHRTQIVHELDASIVTFYLNIRPNVTVCESGTGSGAMSHVLLRTLAPRGRLHTYEFNAVRAKRARDEFNNHGLGHLVTVHHRDVCGKKLVAAGEVLSSGTGKISCGDGNGNGNGDGDGDGDATAEETKATGEEHVGGFGLGPTAAHAVFLDLPEPWLAIPHAAHVLKANGRIASYSPCVEQSQRAIQAMAKCGFHSIKTIEVRLREHHVDEVELERPPSERLEPEVPQHPDGGAAAAVERAKKLHETLEREAEVAAAATAASSPEAAPAPTKTSGGKKDDDARTGSTSAVAFDTVDTGVEADDENTEPEETEAAAAGATTTTTTSPDDEDVPTRTASAGLTACDGVDTGAEADDENTEAEMDTTGRDGGGVVAMDVELSTTAKGNKSERRNGNGGGGGGKGGGGVAKGTSAHPSSAGGGGFGGSSGAKRRKLLCSRPFPSMRGHTAFLTFATAGNAPCADPNASTA